METLGYDRYGAAGGDWGAIITTQLARVDGGRHLCGLHLTSPHGEPPDDDRRGPQRDRPQGSRGLGRPPGRRDGRARADQQHAPAHARLRAERLSGRPAAWLLDKYRSYSDCEGDVERSFTKDELLAQITTYWVTGTIASASRLYYERAQDGTNLPLPTASRSRRGAPSSPAT